jgi:hypothetical protein
MERSTAWGISTVSWKQRKRTMRQRAVLQTTTATTGMVDAVDA